MVFYEKTNVPLPLAEEKREHGDVYPDATGGGLGTGISIRYADSYVSPDLPFCIWAQ